MKIIAIETSCDETSIALLENKKIIDCLTWSQINYFQQFGGVVPQIASQLHSNKLPLLVQKIIKQNKITWKEIDLIAYTKEPGLIGCLKIGQSVAQTLSLFHKIPILAINHLHAHIYAVNLKKEIQFPALAVIVSGGHSQIIYMPENLVFEKMGETLDDAVGETLDKIGRALNLGYPAGAKIEMLAREGKAKYIFQIYKNSKDLNFSLSGLKTSAIRLIKKNGLENIQIHDFAFSLQKIIFETIKKKVELALQKKKVKNIILAGGVAANQKLNKEISKIGLPVLSPAKKYCTDNAAMIAVMAYYQSINHRKH